MNCWVNVEPKLLERKLRGSVEGVFQLGEKGLIVLLGPFIGKS